MPIFFNHPDFGVVPFWKLLDLNLSRFTSHFADSCLKTCFHQFSPALISHLISLPGLRRWCPAFRLCCRAGRLCPLLHPGDVRCAAGRSEVIGGDDRNLCSWVKLQNTGNYMKTWSSEVHSEQYILGSTTFMSDVIRWWKWSASRLLIFLVAQLHKAALEISGMFKLASAKALEWLEYVTSI